MPQRPPPRRLNSPVRRRGSGSRRKSGSRRGAKALDIPQGPCSYDSCLHKMEGVRSQADHGLHTLERIQEFMRKVIQHQRRFANMVKRFSEDELKIRAEYNEDDVKGPPEVYETIVNYYLASSLNHLKVSKNLEQCLAPFTQAINDTDLAQINAAKKELKIQARMDQHRKTYDDSKNKSLSRWEKMKQARLTMDHKAQKHGAREKKTLAAKEYFERQVTKTAMQFQSSEKAYADANSARRQIYKTDTLAVARDYHEGELHRLKALTRFGTEWKQQVISQHECEQKYLAKLQPHLDTFADPVAAIAELKDRWLARDPVVPLPDIRLGLPTSSKVIAANQADLGKMLHNDNINELCLAYDRIVHPPPKPQLERVTSPPPRESPTRARHRSARSIDWMTNGSSRLREQLKQDSAAVASKNVSIAEEPKHLTTGNPLDNAKKWMEKVNHKSSESMDLATPVREPSLNNFPDILQEQADAERVLEAQHVAPTQEYVSALYEFKNPDPNMINFKPGDLIVVMSKDPSGWWRGCVAQGNAWSAEGLFPGNYTTPKTFG